MAPGRRPFAASATSVACRRPAWCGGDRTDTWLAFTDLDMNPAILAGTADGQLILVDLDADLVQAVCALAALEVPARLAITLLADAYDFRA
jgi:hypothetical protein